VVKGICFSSSSNDQLDDAENNNIQGGSHFSNLSKSKVSSIGSLERQAVKSSRIEDFGSVDQRELDNPITDLSGEIRCISAELFSKEEYNRDGWPFSISKRKSTKTQKN